MGAFVSSRPSPDNSTFNIYNYSLYYLRLMSWLKNTLKYYLNPWFYRHKLTPAVGIQQRQLMQHYLVCQQNGQLPDIRTTGFKVFSQFEEDGILLYLFSIIGEGSKTFVEIGANDGINSNC